MRCMLNREDRSIKSLNKSTNSMLLKNEIVRRVIEYDTDQMLLHIDPTDLLIVKDWKYTRLI